MRNGSLQSNSSLALEAVKVQSSKLKQHSRMNVSVVLEAGQSTD